MKTLKEDQIEFFEKLDGIREANLEISMIKLNRKNKRKEKNQYSELREVLDEDKQVLLKSLINEALVDCIINICELIDGYGTLSFEVDMLNKTTGESIKNGVEFHDRVVDYIYYNRQSSNCIK